MGSFGDEISVLDLFKKIVFYTSFGEGTQLWTKWYLGRDTHSLPEPSIGLSPQNHCDIQNKFSIIVQLECS